MTANGATLNLRVVYDEKASKEKGNPMNWIAFSKGSR
jgi:hypothetical protein